MLSSSDTIVAISTPPGSGGIGVVRVSGPRAREAVAPLLRLRHELKAGRSRFGVVPVMVLLAATYGFTLPWMLNHFPGRPEVVLQTLGAFNLLLFGICAWFAWGKTSLKSG